jgi:hypothetical protein
VRASLSRVRPGERCWLVALLLVIVGALALRAYDIRSLPIFTDEALYLRWASDIWDQKTRMSLFIPLMDDGKQPLFMWLSVVTMRLFDDPLVAGRAVSVVAGTCGAVGVVLTGRRLGGVLAGLVAGVLYAVAPFAIFYDRMALPESLVSAAAVWSLCLGVYGVTRTQTRRDAVLLGIALGTVLGAALWTKLSALWIVPVPLLCMVLLRDIRKVSAPAIGLAVGYGMLAVFGVLLMLAPGSDKQMNIVSMHSLSPSQLLSFPVDIWAPNASNYWTWIQTYLPAPLFWLVLAAVPWGLVFRRRVALLLLGSWVVLALPPLLLTAHELTTRYMVHTYFPLLILAALPVQPAMELLRSRLGGNGRHQAVAAAMGAAVLLGVTAPSLAFDLRFDADPVTSNLAETDRYEYINSWASGYGFQEALDLVLRRAAEYNQLVFVLSDHFAGLPRDGLVLYLKGVPNVRHYVDGHIPWSGVGLVDAWRSHNVSILVVRNDGRYPDDSFESQVPEAKLIGLFWKPDGKKSFRVYEMDLRVPGSSK